MNRSCFLTEVDKAEWLKYKQKVTILLTGRVPGWMLPLTEQLESKGRDPRK